MAIKARLCFTLPGCFVLSDQVDQIRTWVHDEDQKKKNKENQLWPLFFFTDEVFSLRDLFPASSLTYTKVETRTT
ncbi:unnamed protein product [Prunus armeniaca]|uniref:Uncharacterized protein n=1 Tax=Prunus armeniaca TaxID=36596 RepID=A0A6J5VPR1_PRUAR|nr:unnamed protein product [Prunus armeniaca]